MSDPIQIWVRNDKGKVWGPLMPATLELLFDNGLIPGKVQLSLDGMDYVYPARLPEVREAVPQELWGDAGPGPLLSAAPAPATQTPPGPFKIPGGRPTLAPIGAAQRVPPTLGPAASRVPPTLGPPALTPSGPAPASPTAPGVAPLAGPGVAPIAGAGAAARARPAGARVAGPGAAAQARAAAAGQPRAPVAGQAPLAGPGAAAQPRPSAAPMAGPGTAAAAQARAAAATAPVRAADKRALSPELGAPAAPPAPEPIAPITLPTLEIPPDGDVQTTSPLRLYYLAAASDSNGLLTLALSDRTVQIHFRKGNPEFVDSSHAEDQLSTFLVKNQLASFDQLGKAEKEKARFGGELIGALFGLGILNPGTAFQHLGQRAAAILFRGLCAEGGTFSWELKELPSHKSMPLGNRWAVVAEQVRKLPGPDLRRRLNAAIDLPVMKSGGQVAVADLRMTPQETRALSYFDGVRSLNQLIHDLPLEADHILRVAFLLEKFDAVSFASVRVPPPQSHPPPPEAVAPPKVSAAAPPKVSAAPPKVSAAPPKVTAAAPPRVTAPGAPPAAGPASAARPPPPRVTAAPRAPVVSAPAVDPAAEIKQLTATLEKMKTQNHFEVLGLKDNADAAAVKLAYFKSARSYHPDTVPPDAPPLLAKLKEEIFARVGEANRTLSDDKLRAEYAEEARAGNAGEKVDIAQILAAEELFQKGSILVKARKFPEAVKMLDEAIKAADESEYYAWRGYAKFFTNPDKKAGHLEAMKDLGVCLKRNDKIAAAWYFQGHMAKLLGDLPAAKKHFSKCIQLNPEHLDAQRELRMMK